MGRSDRTIVVTGATGRQGSAAIRKLRQRNWEIRGLTRDLEGPGAKAIEGLGAECLQVDLSDPIAVRNAMKDAYGVFCVLAWRDGGPQMEMIHGRNVADAAKAVGVEHFVYSSVGGADRRTGIPHFESKWENEEYIRKLDLPWTTIRPVHFFENYSSPSARASILNGELRSPFPMDTPVQMIAVDDIGGFACMAFEDRRRWLKTATEVAGDELSMKQICESFGRVLGRDVRYERVPLEELDLEERTMNRWIINEGYRANIPALRKMRPSLMNFDRWLEKGSWSAERKGMTVPA